MDDLYKEGLDDHARAVYEENQLYEKQRADYQSYLAGLSEDQRAKADAMHWEEQITEAHNRRMAKIEGDQLKKTVEAEKKTAKAKKESAKAQREALKSSTQSAANLLGVGLREQAAIMIPWEIADAASDFADFLTTKDATLLASSLANLEAAQSWGEATKSAKSGGGGGGGGKGRNRNKGGGGGGPGNDVPGRGTDAPQVGGFGNIRIDTGRLRGKMLMGDAGDIMNWTLSQLNQKYKQNARIDFL